MTYLCICERYTHDSVSFRPSAGPVLVTLHPGPLLQPELSQYTLHSTRSLYLVSITMVELLCSQTILQKSARVSGSGPWGGNV